MAATTDTNLLYVRYSDTPGITTTQPASTAGTPDPGAGWETKVYLNFNGDYEPRDVDNNIRTPQPYVRHDENNLPVAVAPYQRHDDDNNPV